MCRRVGARCTALAVLLCGLLLSGCLSLGTGGEDVGQRTAEGGSAGVTITVDELDQITKSFADRYVLLLANACDEIKREAASPEQRRDAHRLKLAGATAAYDVATGPEPVMQLVDLAVIVGLQKLVWVDEGQAVRLFGAELGAGLSEALVTADQEIWGLCALAMQPEQIQILKAAIQTWRRSNPGLEWITNIRFDVVAGGEGAPLIDGIVGTLSAPSGAITDSVGQARLFGQRTFYYFKRLPILMDWQIEAALGHVLAIPEAGEVIQRLASLLEAAAALMARLDALAAPSDGSGGGEVDPKLREIHLLLAEGKDLVLAARETAGAFAALLQDRPTSQPDAGAAPFDINAYTAAGAQFAQTLREATALLNEARSLAESESAVRQVEDLVNAAARGVADQQRDTIDHIAWRAAQVITLTIVLLALYTALIFWLRSSGRAADSR